MSLNPNDIDAVLRETLADKAFSRSERRELSDWLNERGLDHEDLAFVRHRAFALARRMDDRAAAIDWLEGVNKTLASLQVERTVAASAAVHFSPGDACLRAILAALRNARERVDICVFTITDNRISEEIVATSHRGVRIRLISDNEKSEDRGSDIRSLEAAGVGVRLDRSEHHMHHKYALFDTGKVLTGSYNWTRSAAAYNQENLLITNAPDVVQQYAMHFSTLWATLA